LLETLVRFIRYCESKDKAIAWKVWSRDNQQRRRWLTFAWGA